MDIAPALLPAQMPQFEGDNSLKQDDLSFQKILMTKTSNMQPAPLPKQVIKSSPAITEESITDSDLTLQNMTSEEDSSEINSENDTTLNMEAYSDPQLPASPPVNPFEHIKVVEPPTKAPTARSEEKGELTAQPEQTGDIQKNDGGQNKTRLESPPVSVLKESIPEVSKAESHKPGQVKNSGRTDSPVNNSSISAVDAGGKQPEQLSDNRAAGIYQSTGSANGEIAEPFQKKKGHLTKKSGKTEERQEVTAKSSAGKEVDFEKNRKTSALNHTGNYVDKEFSKQKPGNSTPGLNGTFETNRETSTEIPAAERQDEAGKTSDLSDQKRFSNPPADDKRNAEISQNTRKTAGHLFRKIESFIKTGKSEFSLKLYPETLGTLQIKINSDGDLLKIHMTAQNHISKNAIETTLSELKSSLTEKGFQTDQLSVSVGRDGSFSNSGNSNMNNGSSDLRGTSFRSSPENDLSRENVSGRDNKSEIVSSISNVNIFV